MVRDRRDMYIGHHPNVTAINSSIQHAVTIINSFKLRDRANQGRSVTEQPADFEPHHCSEEASRRRGTKMLYIILKTSINPAENSKGMVVVKNRYNKHTHTHTHTYI